MLIPGCPACAGRGSKSAYHNQYIIKSVLCTGLHFQIQKEFPYSSPTRRAVLRGQRQGAALHPRLRGGRSCADSGRALPCTRAYAASGPTRTAAGRCPAPVPTRRAPKGSALWTPAGANAPDPEMLTHLHLACGRDGRFGCSAYRICTADQPAIRPAGWSGLCWTNKMIKREFCLYGMLFCVPAGKCPKRSFDIHSLFSFICLTHSIIQCIVLYIKQTAK